MLSMSWDSAIIFFPFFFFSGKKLQQWIWAMLLEKSSENHMSDVVQLPMFSSRCHWQMANSVTTGWYVGDFLVLKEIHYNLPVLGWPRFISSMCFIKHVFFVSCPLVLQSLPIKYSTMLTTLRPAVKKCPSL